MGKTAFEEQVRRALLDVNYQEFEYFSARADAIAYTPSPRHLTWERRFLAAPFSYAKKRARPMWKRVLQTAACVLLAVSVAFGGVMAVSPAARAWVQQIIAQWFGEYARFSFSGNAGQETGEWKTTWLPEGFELVEEVDAKTSTNIIYKDKDGAFIRLIYSPVEGSMFGTNSEYQSYEEVLVNGTAAYLLQATTQGKPSYLVWADAIDGVAFKLSTTGDAENLIQLAEGIKKIK